MPGKSVLGLSEKHASMLAYAGIFVSGILILIFERENKTVRFHAMQSTVFFLLLLVATSIVTGLLGWIWLIGPLVNFAVSSICIAVWLYLIYKAYCGDTYKIPIIGEAAWNQVNK
ncbi:MAG: DUF4870 domain-containing protein [Defluviitaleaceae bacterium]|nr:DUF4870 domain-containing protein [Defluviitaleaceae bacterium]